MSLLCSAMLFALLLTGCMDSSVENLLSLPQLPTQYTELSRQIDELVKDGYEYTSPTSGRNIQAVQMVDLDGDGYDEAVAFMRLPSDEKQQKIFVFHHTEESYTLLCTIESAGTGIESVYYRDVTGDGELEVIVGWRISSDVQSVAVYALGTEPTVLMRSGYTRFSIEDLDGDGLPSLLLFRTDSEGISIAEFYTWRDESMTVSYHCPLSSDMAALSRGGVVSGKLTNEGEPAVFVTGVDNQGMAITDILTFRKELGLVNVTLDASTGRSKAVYPYCQLQPQDINSDGVIELPDPMPDGSEDNQVGGIISWMRYDSNEGLKWIADTYHCPNADWYFALPEAWHNRCSVTAAENTSSEGSIRLQVDQEDVLALYSISGANRESQAARGNLLVLERQLDVIYAVELFPAAEKYGMDQETAYYSFHLITNFWQS